MMDARCIHPGGFAITRRAIELCGLPKEARVLDIGCGEGETAGYLKEEFGFDVTGIDSAPEMVKSAQKTYPGLTFLEGDAELLSFPSAVFDCVLMECALSLVPDQQEAIHEAYCVLKKGGFLIVHDLYIPKPLQADFDVIERIRQAKASHNQSKREGGDCGEGRVSECVVNGALLLQDIHAVLQELDFEMLLFEDRKQDLDSFAASVIFAYGSWENYQKAKKGGQASDPTGLRDTDMKDRRNQSYFLLVARKKAKQAK